MFNKKSFFVYAFLIVIQIFLSAQTQLAVPLGDPVYYVLEQAQLRGLCAYLPGAKPYSRAKVLSIIEEILNRNETRKFGGLTGAEREILVQFRETFSPNRMGLDLVRGAYSVDHVWNDVYFSGEFGFGVDFAFAGGYYPVAGGYSNDDPDDPFYAGASHPESGDFFLDADTGISVSFKGDLGRNVSYGLTLSGRVLKSPRTVLGTYNNYWDGFSDRPGEYENRLLTIYSGPLAYFPYSYKKSWDGFVWAISNVSNSSQLAWPESVSIGYSMTPEFAGTLLNGHIFLRAARLDREWAGMANNGSLVLNQSAQPFLALETTIVPFNWLMISSLTGVLEYHNAILPNNYAEIKDVAKTFQNSFSIVMLELNYLNYFHVDFGSSVVWSKRSELGYLFPFADNFLYQNNIGDFDNMAMFLNLKGQYPGLGKLWFSFFLDEANPEKSFFELDRMMYAYQAGGSIHIPWWLPFSSATISYTKIEPYNYSHTRTIVPWYGNAMMEANYVNNGVSLGHYIPPNSDEILFRLESIPVPQSMVSMQYQLIRHGADYGSRAVDGSSLWSELDPSGRSEKPALRKYFLRDGAYQWMHIFRFRGEYSLTASMLPIKLFGEIGGVYSYFTDIEGEANSGSPGSYNVINTPEYPHSLKFIAILGVQIFPK